jgi:UDP-2-acetamido-2,6-beta-L-arabino-hexul-4-ose reductase
MEILNLYVINSDDRGVFHGITNKYTWGEINFIETNDGVERGGHYHKFTKELFYILEGEIEVSVCHLVTGEKHHFVANQDMVFIIDPYEIHTFKTVTDAKWINMLSHKLDLERPDIHRVAEKEHVG